jgi:predicted ribosome quality control (RQC) complex YloA/Tae2 family protein
MFKNYFILNRLIIELNEELHGYRVIRVFTYEKNKLVLVLIKNKEEKILEISVNPGFPFLRLKRKISVPKRNLVDLFNLYLPMNNISFEIADTDRIIKIKSDGASIYLTIRGKYTNVYFVNDSEIQSFKKTDEKILNNFNQEINNHTFIREFKNLDIREEFINPDSIRKKFPFVGKEIINEAAFREQNTYEISVKTIKQVIGEIKSESPALFIDELSGEINPGIETFSIFSFTRKEIFNNLIDAFNQYLILKFSLERISDKRKIIERYLYRELNKISGKLNSVQTQIQRGSLEEEYNRKANLLLININKISKGMNEIELQDIYEEQISVSIKLDPELSPQQNADLYFGKARNEKKKLQKSKLLFTDLNRKFKELKNVEEKFLKAEASQELNLIMKELKLDREEKKKNEDSIKSKFRHYIIQNKYNVFVGKDGKSNDLLTMKFAKQNDYWFHARGVSGSHAVLKNEYPKEGIPKNILKLTASIAAYHSKAKTSGMAPVSYTQRKYVTKKKGMEPGKVALLKEEVLIVKPEIPAESRYESES